MRKLLLLVACLSLCYAPDCRAMLKSESLLSYCQVAKKTVWTDNEMIQLQFCNGYTQGISDAIQLNEAMVDAHGRLLHKQTFCLPDDGISTTEAALVYLKYMDAHPEELHEEASVTVWNALTDAYRCTAKPK